MQPIAHNVAARRSFNNLKKLCHNRWYLHPPKIGNR